MFPVSLTDARWAGVDDDDDGFSMLLILSLAIVSHSKVLTLLVLQFANYNTGNAIGTLITITGTVIKKLQYR
jgi:hypothetical protein